MGEYMRIINLDKKELVKIVPYKFWEQIANHFIPIVLYILVTEPTPEDSIGLGWGDISKLKEVIGRWAGDRIIILGDYNPKLDYDEEEDVPVIIHNGERLKLKNITCEILPPIMEYLENEALENLAQQLKESYELECKKF